MEICGKVGNLDRHAPSDPSSGLQSRVDALAVRLCSACPGDYEDPDLTAGEDFTELLAEYQAADATEGGQADA